MSAPPKLSVPNLSVPKLSVPKLSVIVITYNHERFIRQAIDSVLGQKTPFPVEILISEDCSTDSTRSIVQDYAKAHPARIKILLSEQNMNSNFVLERGVDATSGQYLAFLDGDDYWTSDEKLRRQANFLDNHPDVSLCFHDAIQINENGLQTGKSSVWAEMPRRLGLKEIVAGNHVPTCGAVVRRLAITPLPPWYRNAVFGDWPLWIAAAKVGALAFIPEVLGARRVHSGGMWSGRTPAEQVEDNLRFLQQLEASGVLGGEPSLAVTRAVWELRGPRLIDAERLDRLFALAGTTPRLKAWYGHLLK